MSDRAEASLRATLACLPVFVSRIDAANRLTYINHVMPGLDPDAVLGRDVLDFVAPAYHEVALRTFATVRERGESATYSAVAGETGTALSYFDNHVIPAPDEPGGLCILGIDMTARETLRTQPAPSEKALERIPRWMWFPDEDTVHWNDAMLDLVGVEAPLQPAAYLERCVHYQDVDLVRERIARLLDGERLGGSVHRLLRPDGTVRWVQTAAAPEVRHDGRRVLQGTVTPLDPTGETLSHLRARQRENHLKHLVAEATECMTTTLHVLVQNLSVLQEEAEHGARPEVEDCLRATEDATRHLHRLGRLSAVPADPSPHCDLRVALRFAHDLLPAAARARIRYEPDPFPVLLTAHRHALLTALMDLVQGLASSETRYHLQLLGPSSGARLNLTSVLPWAHLPTPAQDAARQAIGALADQGVQLVLREDAGRPA